MSEITSNAYNFGEHITGSVDPRTGSYSIQINMGEFSSHKGYGPNFALKISYSSGNSVDSGFGRGWSLPISSFNKNTRVLSLVSGQSFKIKWNQTSQEYEMPYRRIRDMRVFYIEETGELKVVHKDGKEEYLNYDDGTLTRIVAPNGLEIYFEYSYQHNKLLLWHIFDNAGTSVEIDWWSNKYKSTLIHQADNVIFQKYTFSKYDADKILRYFHMDGLEEFTYIQYVYFKESRFKMISRLTYPTGLVEEIEYRKLLYMPKGAPFKQMPCVYKHTIYPGANQPKQETLYQYSHTNYFGFASERKWLPGEDNLFYSRSDYSYSTTEIINQTKAFVRRYNKYHLLYETRHENNNVIYKKEEIEYYADVHRPIEEQPAQYALQKCLKVTNYDWSTGSEKTRCYIFRTEYDEYGNKTKEIAEDGSFITRVYYPVTGEEGFCPADPNGFVVHLKSETYTPPTGSTLAKLEDTFKYKKLDKLNSVKKEYFIVFTSKIESSGVITDQKYFEDESDKNKYGKVSSEIQTINSIVTKTEFDYFLEQDEIKKTITIRTYDGLSSLFTEYFSYKLNKKIKEINIEGQVTTIDYDQLGRETVRTLHPDYPNYTTMAKNNYHVLVDNNYLEQTDQNGNVKKIVLNNAGNVIKICSKQKGKAEYSLMIEHFYDQFGLNIKTDEYDYNGDDIQLYKNTRRFEYDPEGEISKIISDFGLQETITQNLVDLTCTYIIQGLSKVISYYDSKGREIKKETYNSDGEMLIKTTKEYDGYGNEIKITDTDGNEIKMTYDNFDRLKTVTRAIDNNEIIEVYSYPNFTRADNPTKIEIDNIIIGQRNVDGLLRIKSEISAGVTTRYCYKSASPLMDQIITASEETITFKFDDVLRQVIKRSVSNDKTLDSTTEYYNNTGYIKKTTNLAATIAYFYDSFERVIKETVNLNNGKERESIFNFTLVGKTLDKTDFDDNKRSISYDEFGRPNKITDTHKGKILESVVTDITYDEFSRAVTFLVTRNTVSNTQKKTKLELTLNSIGAETERKFYVEDSKVLTISQTYNSNMLIKTRITTDLEKSTKEEQETTEKYSYDTLKRLKTYEVTGPGKPYDDHENQIKSQIFSHDKYGNIIKVISVFSNNASNTQKFIYNGDVPVRLGEITNTHHSYSPRILFYYDADGNLVNDEKDRWYRYNALGLLDAVISRDHRYLSQYKYNSFGDMVSQQHTDGTMEYLYYSESVLVNEICENVVSNYQDHAVGLFHREVKNNKSENGNENECQLLFGTSQESTIQTRIINNANSSKDTKLVTTYTPYGALHDHE